MKFKYSAIALALVASATTAIAQNNNASLDDKVALLGETAKLTIATLIDHEGKLDALGRQVTDGSNKIGTLTNTVAGLQQDVSHFTKAFETLGEWGTAFNTWAEEVEKFSEQEEKRMEELEEKVAKNTQDIATKASIDAVTRIAEYADKVGQVVNQHSDAITGLAEDKADKSELKAFRSETLGLFKELAEAAIEGDEILDAKIDTVANQKADKIDLTKLQDDVRTKTDKLAEKVDEKADKSSLDVVKNQLANVAISTYRLDRDIENHADVLDDHADQLEALAEYTNLAVEVVNQHSDAIVAQGEDIEKLKETANNHVDAINALAHDYRTVTTNHANVLKNLAEDKADKSEVKEANDLAVEALKSLAAVEDAIDMNVEAIEENAKAIAANKTAAESATAAANAATEQAKEAKRAADSVESTAASAKTEATAAKSVADNAREIATTAEGKADANAGKIKTLEGGYATLVTTTNTLNTQVRDLDARVKANTDRINQLDLRVENVQKEMRRGLAAQAALSGLFQPYTVGKANITAAVGGYKSQTAIAVGAGYRFNAKFAAKAGLAFNTSGSGMAYNVAVNYEF